MLTSVPPICYNTLSPSSSSDEHKHKHTLPLLLFRRTQTQTHSPPPPLQTNTNTTHKHNTPPLLPMWRANTNKHSFPMLRDKGIHQGKENIKLSNLQTPLPSLFGGFEGVLSKAGEWKSGHWLQANPLQRKREASLRRKESPMWGSSSWGREGGRADKGGTGSRGPLSGRQGEHRGNKPTHSYFSERGERSFFLA